MKQTMKGIYGALIICSLICMLFIAITLKGFSMGILGVWNPFKKERIITEELALYVQELTGIGICDLCEKESGEIQRDSSGDYACICLELKQDGCRKMQERLEAGGHTPLTGDFIIPGYDGHEIAKKLKREKIAFCYSFFFEGNGRTKTRSAELYLTTDRDGLEFLYFFG